MPRPCDMEVSDVAVGSDGEEYSLSERFGEPDMTSDPYYQMLYEEAQRAGFDTVESYLNS